MNKGARIAALGKALRQTAGEVSGDFNERCYLAHCALVCMLRDNPSLEGIKISGPDGQHMLRKALCAADLKTRTSTAYLSAQRRALLAP